MCAQKKRSFLKKRWDGFRAVVREAFSGSTRDYTTGSIGKAITILAIPMVLEMLMQSVFGVVDVYFVGKLGADAVAAVGLTDSLLILVLAVGMGMSIATTAMVARRIGEENVEGAGIAACQALIAGMVISIPISIVGLFFAPDLFRLMGASPGVVDTGSIYCTILFGTNAAILFLFLINAIFRGAGDAVPAMRALWLANIINMILDPILIFGLGPFPEMGIMGAAVATTTGRMIGITYQLSILVRGHSRLMITRRLVRLEIKVMRRLLRISLPGMLQYIIGTASWLGLFRILAEFGSSVLAGYTIAIRIVVFALLPSWGMGNAAATLVGQNLGARKPDRAERSVWIAAFSNMVFLGVVSVFMIVFARPLIQFFSDDAAVIKNGVDTLRIVSYTYVFFAFGMVTVQAFNGAGDTTTPTWIRFLSAWVIEIPLAYVLAVPLGMGAKGVFWAIAIAQTTLALIATFAFKRGRWKEKMI